MVFRIGRTHRLSQGQKEAREFCGYFVIGLVMLLIPVFAVYYEVQNFNIIKVVNEMNDVGIVDLGEHEFSSKYFQLDLTNIVGKPVYLHSKHIEGKNPIRDDEFNIHLPNTTLMLRRNFEYCQWMEHSTTHEDSEGHEYVTYFYTKGWTAFPIISLLFDQPFTHHNPLRQPYKSLRFEVDETKLGNYSLTHDVTKKLNSWRKADFSPRNLKDFSESPASKLNNFHYTGNGMFYSPYEEKNAMLLVRMFGQFLEGTLLDWQVGDIIGMMINSCTPGDIRVQYEHISPKNLSVVGKLLDKTGRIGPYVSENGYSFSSISEGFYSHEELLAKELSSANFYVILMRICMSLWCFLILAGFGYSSNDNTKFAITGIAMALAYWLTVTTLTKI